MGKQVRVNLTINEDVVKKAKEIGLNISKISENALIWAIKALENVDNSKGPNIYPVSNKDVEKWAGPDSNR